MPKTKIQKQVMLRDLEEKITASNSIIFAGFDALGVKDNEEIRLRLKEKSGEYLVAKKTLINLACQKKGIKDLDAKNFPGKIAAIFAYDDAVAPSKELDNWRKGKEEKVYFLGGILDGKIINQEEVEALAKLPSREELYAKLVGSINSPISGLVNALAGNLRNLVGVLQAIEKNK